jgi:hypothetical protein
MLCHPSPITGHDIVLNLGKALHLQGSNFWNLLGCWQVRKMSSIVSTDIKVVYLLNYLLSLLLFLFIAVSKVLFETLYLNLNDWIHINIIERDYLPIICISQWRWLVHQIESFFLSRRVIFFKIYDVFSLLLWTLSKYELPILFIHHCQLLQ